MKSIFDLKICFHQLKTLIVFHAVRNHLMPLFLCVESEIEIQMMDTEWSIFVEICKTNVAIADHHFPELYDYFRKKSFFSPIPNVKYLMEIALIIPATSSICERSFSKLKLIETFFKKHYVTGTIK